MIQPQARSYEPDPEMPVALDVGRGQRGCELVIERENATPARSREGIQRISGIGHLVRVGYGETKILVDGVGDVAEARFQRHIPNFLGIGHLRAEIVEAALLVNPNRKVSSPGCETLG